MSDTFVLPTFLFSLSLNNKDAIEDITVSDVEKMKYHEVDEAERWRIDAILELTDVKFDQAAIEGLTSEEFEEILDFICTS